MPKIKVEQQLVEYEQFVEQGSFDDFQIYLEQLLLCVSSW